MKPMNWNATTIRSLAAAYGDTQEAFARRLDCSFSTVSGWINERHMPSPAYCRTLDAITAELAALAEPSTPDLGATPYHPQSPGTLANRSASGSGVDSSDNPTGDAT